MMMMMMVMMVMMVMVTIIILNLFKFQSTCIFKTLPTGLEG